MYRTVFVIDDSPIDRTLTSVVIQKKAFAEHVICFNSGEAALKHIYEHRTIPAELPQVIFLDIHMPLMDGFGFLEKYMEQEADAPNKPMVFLVSSSTNDSDHRKIKNFSIVKKFIPKPMTMDVLGELMIFLKDEQSV